MIEIEVEIEDGNVKDNLLKYFAQFVGRKLGQCSQDNYACYRLITEACCEENRIQTFRKTFLIKLSRKIDSKIKISNGFARPLKWL